MVFFKRLDTSDMTYTYLLLLMKIGVLRIIQVPNILMGINNNHKKNMKKAFPLSCYVKKAKKLFNKYDSSMEFFEFVVF